MLLNIAAMHDNNSVGQSHCFDLVVGHIDHIFFDSLPHDCQFGAHLAAQFSIKIGQWFVEQEDITIFRKRPRHGDALALSARQGTGLAV